MTIERDVVKSLQQALGGGLCGGPRGVAIIQASQGFARCGQVSAHAELGQRQEAQRQAQQHQQTPDALLIPHEQRQDGQPAPLETVKPMFGLPLLAIAIHRAAQAEAFGRGVGHVHAPAGQTFALGDGGRPPARVHRPGARLRSFFGSLEASDESKARALFANREIRELMPSQTGTILEVQDKTISMGAGVYQLYFSHTGLLIDLHRLHAIFDLFTETLNQLVVIGSASEVNAPVEG
jgi:hypothetical protein